MSESPSPPPFCGTELTGGGGGGAIGVITGAGGAGGVVTGACGATGTAEWAALACLWWCMGKLLGGDFAAAGLAGGVAEAGELGFE